MNSTDNLARIKAQYAASPVAAGDDLVVALLVAPHELGDQLRRVLQVGVHDDDGVTGGGPQAGEHGRLLAEVAAERDDPHARAKLGDGQGPFQRRILAAIVNENEFCFART